MQSVKDAGFQISGEKMTLLGAGGAATAILVQAALDGVREISVFLRPSSRFYDRARETAEALRKKTGCIISLCDFPTMTGCALNCPSSRILTNAHLPREWPPARMPAPFRRSLPSGRLIVSDIIYNPKETRLLSMARAKGLPAFNGSYMLLYQVPRPSVSGPERRCQWRRSRRNFSPILFIQKAT